MYRLEPACVVFGIGNSLVLFGRKQHCAELVHTQRRATPAQQLIVNGHAVATGKCLLSQGELVPTLPNTPIVLIVLPPPAHSPCPQPTVHWTCRGILFTHEMNMLSMAHTQVLSCTVTECECGTAKYFKTVVPKVGDQRAFFRKNDKSKTTNPLSLPRSWNYGKVCECDVRLHRFTYCLQWIQQN